MEAFDPHTQLVSFLAADGETPIQVPVDAIDSFNEESVSVSINYGAQLGACIIMLFVMLIMTPSHKFHRPSSVLHIAALVVSIVRMALLSAYFPSPFNEFYNFWAADYSSVPMTDFYVSIAGNTFSLILVVVIEAALFNQAWAMVSLWPNMAKYTLSILSVGITLVTVGWRIAFTVIQNKAVLSLVPPAEFLWVAHSMVITNALSICWFCALFNVKIVSHLVTNRSVLPSNRALTPMEILIMTNGLLMVIPGKPASSWEVLVTLILLIVIANSYLYRPRMGTLR
jgi:pheromone alpha factor receptor